jgi:signal transduction histidine kinase
VWVPADPVRLRQVLRNLLSNAARHGGSNVRLIVGSSADRALLEVRDNGTALSSVERERIFLPYERSDEGDAVGSVGLGLHVARLLARTMEGDLTYDHDGRDAVFQLELPLIPAPAGASPDSL